MFPSFVSASKEGGAGRVSELVEDRKPTEELLLQEMEERPGRKGQTGECFPCPLHLAGPWRLISESGTPLVSLFARMCKALRSS